MNSIKQAILKSALVIARQRTSMSRALANLSINYLAAYENTSWDMESNGEAELLRRVAMTSPRAIFDVGANRGDWSREALLACSAATVHAFEISPPTARALDERFAGEARIVINQLGLSDSEREVVIAHFRGHDDNTRILAPLQALPDDADPLFAKISTGDAYCRSNGIRAVDFLKIDVEGHEYQVLKGFEAMLSAQNICMVQFEQMHDFMLRASHCLEDIYNLLGRHGYRLGRLFPRGVVEQPYSKSLERLSFATYVAIAHDKRDLWTRLSYR